jgi:hypothetical protein
VVQGEFEMTVCIGVIDKQYRCCYIGADCGVSYDSHHSATDTPKVFNPCDRKDIVIGCAGSVRMANLLMSDDTLFDGLPEDEYKADDKLIIDLIQTFIPKLKVHAESLKRDNEDFDLILAIRDRLYRVQSDYSIYEASSDTVLGNIIVIGSACETAYGAMMMADSIDPSMETGTKIRKAIGICAYYNYGITPQSTILNT